jgi:hypothetical protein
MRRSRSLISSSRKKLLGRGSPIERRTPRPDEEIWRVDRRRMLRDEIDAAVITFFEGNNIAAGVLTWAALDVLRTLMVRANIVSFHGRLEDYVYDEFVNEWRKFLRDDYNYFKHSDCDPDRVLEDYRPVATAYNLLGAIADYGSLYQAQTLPMATFKAWMFSRYPNLLKEEACFPLQDVRKAIVDADNCDFQTSLISARDQLRLFAANRDQVISQLTPTVLNAFERL